MFNIDDYRGRVRKQERYTRRINQLLDRDIYTSSIETAVDGAILNIKEKNTRSFVIYGEPQSGKTEMMIALTARLLDEGLKTIVVLLNDNVQLLNQNLDRFRRSGLDPAPKNFAEILDPAIQLLGNEWVIFCKKNSRDLRKLLDKLGSPASLAVIDDEADFATPNAKVNKGERTKINQLVGELLGKTGIYIGVTATPARLDLNNTFENDNERWVDFPPHPDYTGQEVFFPLSAEHLNDPPFILNLLPDSGDDPRFLREALFRFFVNVAHLNTEVNDHEKNFSILIHTSGKKADHTEDYKNIVKTLNALKSESDRNFEKYVKEIWEIAKNRYPGREKVITDYVVANRSRHTIIVMNSDIDKKVVDFNSATSPSTLFTIAIGGNIVSRGVTFDNLLSMFFTRDVKHKIQQDTYIQRARMFGVRGQYVRYFELSIPGQLYFDWHKCFIFHKLSLESIRSGNGSPVWLEDNRIASVSSSSIDKTTVSMDKGEMSFELFDYELAIEEIINNEIGSFDKLFELKEKIGNSKLPGYLIQYIRSMSPRMDESLAIHPSRSIAGYHDADQKKIERAKGFIGRSDLELEKFPHAVHHIKVLFNEENKARVFYKYVGSIRFLKNLKQFSHD